MRVCICPLSRFAEASSSTRDAGRDAASEPGRDVLRDDRFSSSLADRDDREWCERRLAERRRSSFSDISDNGLLGMADVVDGPARPKLGDRVEEEVEGA